MALQRPHRFALGLSFADAAVEVGARLRLMLGADHRDRVDRVVGMSCFASSSSSGTVWVMWRPPDTAVSSDVQASMKSRRHPWTAAEDRSLRRHGLASRLVSHPAAAHTLEGASDATAKLNSRLKMLADPAAS